MPTSSTVPAVRAALVAALQARPALSGVQVAARWPGPTTKSEGIYLGDVSGTSTIASIKSGRQRRNETYELEAICQTWHATSTPLESSDSEDRAFALFAEVEGTLADDPRLAEAAGASGVLEVGPFVVETIPFEQGWATRITAGVRVQARLT